MRTLKCIRFPEGRVSIRRNAEYDEYVVVLKSYRGLPASYYTSDLPDARNTAAQMIKRERRIEANRVKV